MAAKALKICILGTAYPYKGGIADFIERLAGGLMNSGHRVHIVTFTLQYPSILYPGKSQYSEALPPNNLSIKRLINTVNPISWIRTGRLLRKEKYDIIISKFWIPVVGMSLGYVIRAGKIKNRTKAIAIIDNIIPHESRPGDNFFTKYFINSIDYALTMSPQVKEATESLFPKTKTSMHPHPIYDVYGDELPKELACKELKLSPSFKYILFFGYIRQYKGLDILLKAFHKVSDSLKDVKVLVAGEYYTDGQEYIDLIQELNLQDKVIMHTDFISNSHVKYYFSAADLVAQTYKSATQSGISQIAINFEKPLLSTNVGGLPETVEVGTNGIIVDPTVDAVANGMMRFFENTNQYYQKSKSGELKNKYSWNGFINALIELYEKKENDN